MTHPLSWRAPAQQKTPRGAPPYFRGPFTCQMTFTMPLKLGAQVPERLFAALLVRSPDSDGSGYLEIEGGWPRLPVRLVSRSASLIAIDHPLLFDVPAQEIAALGLFDSPEAGCGALWFYGALRATKALQRDAQAPSRDGEGASGMVICCQRSALSASRVVSSDG